MSRTWHHSPAKEKIARRLATSRSTKPEVTLESMASGERRDILASLSLQASPFARQGDICPVALLDIPASTDLAQAPEETFAVDTFGLQSLLRSPDLTFSVSPVSIESIHGSYRARLDIATGLQYTWNPNTSTYEQADVINRVEDFLRTSQPLAGRDYLPTGSAIIPGVDDTDLLLHLRGVTIHGYLPAWRGSVAEDAPLTIHAAILTDLG